MNLLKPNFLLALLAMTFSVHVFAQTPLACDGKFYVSHGNGSTYVDSTYIDKIAFSHGLAVQSPLGNSGTIGLNALGFNPLDGFIYGLRYPTGTTKPELVRVDANGAFFSLGAITGDYPTGLRIAWAGCFDAKGNYYVSEDPTAGNISGLYKIDVSTNVSTLIGSTGLAPQSGGDILFVDMAVNPADGKLYGVSSYCCGENGSLSSSLFTIDTTTGAATFIKQITPNGAYFGMFFNDLGQLFVYSNNGDLYTVGLTSGNTTFVGNGVSFTFADACSCVFRVSTFLSADANCVAGKDSVSFTVSTRNYSGSMQNGISYDLTLPDVFQFTQPAATIQTALTSLYGGSVNVSISSVNSGTNNQLNITGMSVPTNDPITQFTSFVLNTTVNSSVPTLSYAVQAHLSGLSTLLGTDEFSDDPTTVDTDDSTQITLPSSCEIILPVEIVSFNATAKSATALLSWVTTSDVTTNYFDVERSTDGYNWFSVGKVNTTSGNSLQKQYSFTDIAPIAGNNFYRLRQVDANGSYQFSFTRSVKFDTKNHISVYPNPSTTSFNLVSNSTETMPFEILDVSGRLIRHGSLTNTANAAGLTPGVYAARVHTKAGTQIVKIVVQ